MPPRVSLPYLLVSLIQLQSLHGFISDRTNLEKTARTLQKLKEKIGFYSPIHTNICKKMALTINKKNLLIFGLERFSSLARRFKCQLNENCNVQARYELIPELTHNEVESLMHINRKNCAKKLAIIMLRTNIEKNFETVAFETLWKLLSEKNIGELNILKGEGKIS